MADQIVLLGAGGQAREVISYLPHGIDVLCAVSPDYLDPAKPGVISVLAPTPEQARRPAVGAVAAPGMRRQMVADWPGERFATVVAAAAYVDPSCVLGAGTIVSPGAVLTVDVVTGVHCLINIGATLSHDVVLGSFVTVCPGANIAGHVKIGDGVFIGAGATVSSRATVASGVVIAAGAAVVDDVTTPNALVTGVPASVAGTRDDWLDIV